MLKVYSCALPALMLLTQDSCENQPSSDTIQRRQQEVLLSEGTAQVGMPKIKNFRERKLYADILEKRDRAIVTYTYIWNEKIGKATFFGETVGYGIPYATQFTNPQKTITKGESGITAIAQADPNGLFSPASAEGTWVFMKDPNGNGVEPVYIESRIIVSPFKLADRIVER